MEDVKTNDSAYSGSKPICPVNADQDKSLITVLAVQAPGSRPASRGPALPLHDRLIIEKPIGLGGFARVWRGTLDGKKVALKVLLEQHVNAAGHVEGRLAPARLLRQEGAMMKELSPCCKYLVRCYEVLELPPNLTFLAGRYEKPVTALALELLEGGAMTQLVKKQMLNPSSRMYTYLDALRWCLDIAQALSTLHNLQPQIIHRDMKSENVMLGFDSDEGRLVAKLTDFGLHVRLAADLPSHKRFLRISERFSRRSNQNLACGSSAGLDEALSHSQSGWASGQNSVLQEHLTVARSCQSASAASHPTLLVPRGVQGGSGDSPRGSPLFLPYSATALAAAKSATAAAAYASASASSTSIQTSLQTPATSLAATTNPLATTSGPIRIVKRTSSLASAMIAASVQSANSRGQAPLQGSRLGMSSRSSHSNNIYADQANQNGRAISVPVILHLAPTAAEASVGRPMSIAAMQQDCGPNAAHNGQGGTPSPAWRASQEATAYGNSPGAIASLMLNGTALRSRTPIGDSDIAYIAPDVASTGRTWDAEDIAALLDRDEQSHTPDNCRHGTQGRQQQSVFSNADEHLIPQRTAAAGAAMVGSLLLEGPLSALTPQEAGLEAFGTAAQHTATNHSVPSGVVVPLLPLSRLHSLSLSDSVASSSQSLNPGSLPGTTPVTARDIHMGGLEGEDIYAASGCSPASDSSMLSGVPSSNQGSNYYHNLGSSSNYNHCHGASSGNGHGAVLTNGTATELVLDVICETDEGAEEDSVRFPERERLAHGPQRFASMSNVPLCHCVGQIPETALNSEGKAAATVAITPPLCSHIPSQLQDTPHRDALLDVSHMHRAPSSPLPGHEQSRGSVVSDFYHKHVHPSGQADLPGILHHSGGVELYKSSSQTDEPQQSKQRPGEATLRGLGPGQGIVTEHSPASVAGSIPWGGEDVAEVWSLTGATGSALYMAPEVYRSEPYNDRVDVFGFGIFMYEVMARSLLAFTHVGTRPAGISQLLADSNAYAERVAKGYRPPRVHAVPEAAWELITSAWHDDPCERPPMDHVVNVLKMMVTEEELRERADLAAQKAPAACGCVIS